MDNRVEKASFILGASILIFLASVLLWNSALFVLHGSMTAAGLWIALAAAVFFIVFSAKKYFRGAVLPVGGVLAAVFLGISACSAVASGIFYDVSYDGQTYHQQAVFQLSLGWNPILDPPLQNEYGLWINHYPKAAWICAAQIFKVTGRIEQSKTAGTLLILASFFLALSAFLKSDPRRPNRALILSFLLALNPVAVYQSLCFYVDGQLASLFAALVVLCYFIGRRLDGPTAFAFAAGTVLLMNVKFTGVIYALVLYGGLAVWLLLRKSPHIFRFAALALASVGLAFFLVGYNPYIANIIRQGHPFYPLAGPKSRDIITEQEPLNFRGAGRAGKLWVSIFSRTENVSRLQTTRRKVPFSLAIPELVALTTSDIRIGGFGPWFGGAFLISAILILAGLICAAARPPNAALWILPGGILLMAVSVLVNPECWWARYAPQLWLIPVGACVSGLYLPSGKAMTYLSKTLAFVLAINVLIVCSAYFIGQAVGTWRLKQQLHTLADCPQPVDVKFDGFTANKLRFAEWGIAYKEAESIGNENGRIKRLYGSTTLVRECGSPDKDSPDE